MDDSIQRGTTTITLSIPKTTKTFFNEIAEDGYNRSQIMLKMIQILEILYRKHNDYPGGLPKAIDRVKEMISHESLKKSVDQE